MTFTDRLRAKLDENQLSQSKLAGELGVSRSTVTGWVRYGKLPDAGLLAQLCITLGCSADWLLGLDTHIEKQVEGLRWIERIPAYIQGQQREQIEYGLRIFNQIVTERHTSSDLYNEYNWQTIRFALKAALRSGAIQITEVQRDKHMEAQLKQRYAALKEAIVAHLPYRYQDTIIRTELVAFLAATEIFSNIIRENLIGFSSGYTLLRMSELSIPSIDQFRGTQWLPLIAFSDKESNTYTPNYIARLLSVRHPGSKAIYLPHESECVTPEVRAQYDEARQLMHNVSTIFVSVSGVDRREHANTPHLLGEFRSADYTLEAPDLRQAYTALEDKTRFGGEVLRCLVDTQGQIIVQDAKVSPQVNLDILRYNSDRIGKVCIVAARAYKALAVRTCLENRLANAIVVDSSIAEALIH